MCTTIVSIYLLGTIRETTSYTFLTMEGISRGKNVLLSNYAINKKYIKFEIIVF